LIKHFSVLYVGFTELDNVGLSGTPADERRYSSEQIAKAYPMALDVAQHMDALGFYALWGAEHHFQHEGYEVIPNLILWGTYLAARTERLKFGCAFNVTPIWHPIRLAEDYALADNLTGGRIIFGVGRGYQTREVETLGAPLLDTDANRELYEEQMEIIMKAFTEESFSHQGKHYTLPAQVPFRGYTPEKISLVPRPLNRPVEIWQAIASGKSIPYMAQHGIKGMISQNGEKLSREIFRTYQAEAAKAGRELALGEDLCLGLGVSIAPTQQEAMDAVRPYHDEAYKWFAPFGFVRYTDEEGRPWGSPGAPSRAPTLEEGIHQRVWLCGPAELVVRELKAYEAEFPGLEHLILRWPEGMPAERFKQQLTLFADKVMPHFG
jgi:alkanesulfonate monooxygenase SsuD/methylene tetrahydromethanopterin reductase-like flavin-dependent oxidoreductase (luciferase family)